MLTESMRLLIIWTPLGIEADAANVQDPKLEGTFGCDHYEYDHYSHL